MIPGVTTERRQLPDTIQAIIDQLGGLRLSSALCYVGASRVGYLCPQQHGEYRGEASRITEDGRVHFTVGVHFAVNGKPREGWQMMVSYEPNDTYTVYLWRHLRGKGGKFGEVLDQRDDVYCEDLKSVVENMYDNAIEKHNGSIIPMG